MKKRTLLYIGVIFTIMNIISCSHSAIVIKNSLLENSIQSQIIIRSNEGHITNIKFDNYESELTETHNNICSNQHLPYNKFNIKMTNTSNLKTYNISGESIINEGAISGISKFNESALKNLYDNCEINEILSSNYKDIFTGRISDNQSNSYLYYIKNIELGDNSNHIEGVITFGKKTIIIKPIHNIVDISNYSYSGFEFYIDKISIGKLQTGNPKFIWFKSDVSEDLRGVIAAISNSLLIKPKTDITQVFVKITD